jgi:hypothetical protein
LKGKVVKEKQVVGRKWRKESRWASGKMMLNSQWFKKLGESMIPMN